MEIDNNLEQTVKELQERVDEYQLKFSTYTKEQAKLFGKVQQCKQKLNKMNLKKTGKNRYQGYNYYELEDINKPICDTLLEHGLASLFIFKEDKGHLQIIDTETGAWVQWSTPMKISERWQKNKDNSGKKGDVGEAMKATQALQTYARRALYLQALEIAEPNIIEQEPKQQAQQETQTLQLTGQDEITEGIFRTIQNDFKKGKVPFNKKTVTNKLNSMAKNGKIDEATHSKCMQILQDAKENEN